MQQNILRKMWKIAKTYKTHRRRFGSPNAFALKIDFALHVWMKNAVYLHYAADFMINLSGEDARKLCSSVLFMPIHEKQMFFL